MVGGRPGGVPNGLCLCSSSPLTPSPPGEKAKREATSEVIVGTAVEPHPLAVLAGNDAEAIVLDLMQPLAAGGQLIGFVGRHGAMNPAGRVRCNMWTK